MHRLRETKGHLAGTRGPSRSSFARGPWKTYDWTAQRGDTHASPSAKGHFRPLPPLSSSHGCPRRHPQKRLPSALHTSSTPAPHAERSPCLAAAEIAAVVPCPSSSRLYRRARREYQWSLVAVAVGVAGNFRRCRSSCSLLPRNAFCVFFGACFPHLPLRSHHYRTSWGHRDDASRNPEQRDGTRPRLWNNRSSPPPPAGCHDGIPPTAFLSG